MSPVRPLGLFRSICVNAFRCVHLAARKCVLKPSAYTAPDYTVFYHFYTAFCQQETVKTQDYFENTGNNGTRGRFFASKRRKKPGRQKDMKKVFAWMMCLALLLCAIGACAEDDAPTFEALAGLEWSFSSGVGGWSTDLRFAEDGSFSGEYHDSEMGDAAEEYPSGTVYFSDFTGNMSILGKADDYAWTVRVDSLVLDTEPGYEEIDGDIRYVAMEPYGISEGDEMLLYLPGTPVDVLTEDMQFWAHINLMEEKPETLPGWLLYSAKNESGFEGWAVDEDVQLANPWVDMTREELEQASGLTLNVPEGAENVVWRWMEADGLAELEFTLDGDEYCARVQPAALEAGELMNISGIYFEWEHEEAVTVGHCEGSLGIAKTGSEDWVENCLWYDLAPGLMYSLSVSTTDPDGLDLTAVAEMVYAPMQGDA